VKFKLVALVLLIAGLIVLPAAAQNAANTLSYNGFGFSFDNALAQNVDITHFAGDPADLQQPGGPEVRHTEFTLYSGDSVPSSYESTASIRVYQTADFAGYEFPGNQLNALTTLVAQKPDLASYMTVPEDNTAGNSLPFMPIFPAAQVIRARARYVENAAVKGITYVTVYRQDVSPFTSDEFFYTFQGLSNDGKYYVSAVFRVNAGVFPAEIGNDFDYNTFSQQFIPYLKDSVQKLNNAAPTDFTPSLDTLDSVIQSFTFGG
jgi:hypothetical protein